MNFLSQWDTTKSVETKPSTRNFYQRVSKFLWTQNVASTS